jgi:maleylpyruvate isomerase
VPAEAWVFRRWREVEIHRVDLAADYPPDRWPPLFVTHALRDAAESLASRVGDRGVAVTVIAEGSVAPDLVGAQWTAGSGTPVEVSGPDWAVLAWLVGRADAAGEVLSAAPSLDDWR